MAKAAPDGYTLVLGGTGSLAINPTLYPNVGYDPRKDFAPIGLIGTRALVLVVHPSVPAKNIKELIALCQGQARQAELRLGGRRQWYPPRGGIFPLPGRDRDDACALQGYGPGADRSRRRPCLDVFQSLPPAIALVKEGKIRALAVTGPARSPIFPELPTIAEAALPGFEAVLHYGIVAPAGTPKPIITKLNAALRQAVMSDDFKQKLAADGTEPLARRPRNTPPTSTRKRPSGRPS